MFKVRVFFETESGVVRSVNLGFANKMTLEDVKKYWQKSGFDVHYGDNETLCSWTFYKAQYFDKEKDLWTDLK